MPPGSEDRRELRKSIRRAEDMRFPGCVAELRAVAPVERGPFEAVAVAKTASFVVADRIRSEEPPGPSVNSGALLWRCLWCLLRAAVLCEEGTVARANLSDCERSRRLARLRRRALESDLASGTVASTAARRRNGHRRRCGGNGGIAGAWGPSRRDGGADFAACPMGGSFCDNSGPSCWASPGARIICGVFSHLWRFGIWCAWIIRLFRTPPAGAAQVESGGNAWALGAPMHAMLVEVLASLVERGLPRLDPHLSALSLAACLRLIRRLAYFGRVLRLVGDRNGDDEATTARSLSVQLARLWRADSVGLWEQIRLRPASPDRLASALLPGLRRLAAAGTLSARIRVFFDDAPPKELHCFFLELRLHVLRWAWYQHTVPASVLRIWCGAVPTARKIDNGATPCPMCGGLAGSGSRHVVVCLALHVVALEVFGMNEAWPMTSGLAAMVMLTPSISSGAARLAPLLVDVGLHVLLMVGASGRDVAAVTRMAFATRLVQLAQRSPRVVAIVRKSRCDEAFLRPIID